MRDRNIDLLLILDCTKSMKPWIDECKLKLTDIIDNVKENLNSHVKIRIALVGYQDFKSKTQMKNQNHFKIFDYTEDIKTAQQNIMNFNAREYWKKKLKTSRYSRRCDRSVAISQEINSFVKNVIDLSNLRLSITREIVS